MISSKIVLKKHQPRQSAKNVNTAFAEYFKQAHEYAKAGQTEFSLEHDDPKSHFDGDDEIKVKTVDGFNDTPANEKNMIAKKIAELSKSFLHRYNKKTLT